jgi:hypothetical protein
MRPLALALLAVVAACGGGAGEGVPGSGDGPALAIEEAIAAGRDGPLLVRGNLLAERDEIRFCSALAESFPPQCGGASLRVEGLDLGGVGGLTSAGDVAWTDRPIRLRGVVEDGVLRVSG